MQVYSFTNGKTKVFVKIVGSEGNLNDILVKKHFGEYVKEDFVSKANHIQRKSQREQNLEHSTNENFIDPIYLDYFFNKEIDIVEPPSASMCNKKIRLSGPYSPILSKVFALTEAIKHSTATIDRFSVNSILMDNDPQVRDVSNEITQLLLCMLSTIVLFPYRTQHKRHWWLQAFAIRI